MPGSSRRASLVYSPAETELVRILAGSWATQCVHVAAKLGLADLLRNGARTSRQLARSTRTHGEALYRLLRVLDILGVVRETSGRRFRLTSIGKLLQSDNPRKFRDVAILAGEERYRAWGDLLDAIRTGKPAFDRVFGQPFYRYFANHTSGRKFSAHLESLAAPIGNDVARAYDFSKISRLVDVGGGEGNFLIAILQRWPHLHGVLLDTPPVIAKARKKLRAARLLDRCDLVTGNFLQSAPADADAYIMLRIIHEFGDAAAVRILQNCRRASPKARILVCQEILGTAAGADFARLADLNMLVLWGGMERARGQFRDLLRRAGYRLTRIISSDAGPTIIEGKPA